MGGRVSNGNPTKGRVPHRGLECCCVGTGEIGQWVKAVAIFAKDPDLIPSKHMVTQNHL